MSNTTRYDVTRKIDCPASNWAGGTTTELFIYPQAALCGKRDFELRISTACVELDESVFSDFTGFLRHIAPLCGEMRLVHEDGSEANLEPGDTHAFPGNLPTRSFGRCVDFNLIHTPAWRGDVRIVSQRCALPCAQDGFTGCYALCDLHVAIVGPEGELGKTLLHPGDFLIVENGTSPCEIALSPVSESAVGVISAVATASRAPS